MKPLFLFLLLILNTSSILSTATHKIKSNTEPDYIECLINGEPFYSKVNAASHGMNIFSFTGMTSTSAEKFVNITITNPKVGMTYDFEKLNDELNVTGITIATALNKNYAAGYSIGSGSITLTHFDGKSAAGTFHAKVISEKDDSESLTITYGKFYISSIIKI